MTDTPVMSSENEYWMHALFAYSAEGVKAVYVGRCAGGAGSPDRADVSKENCGGHMGSEVGSEKEGMRLKLMDCCRVNAGRSAGSSAGVSKGTAAGLAEEGEEGDSGLCRELISPVEGMTLSGG